jgi:hypothetical protein
MTLVSVMNRYHISIHHAALLLNVPEQSIVRWLLEDRMSDYLEECFLYEREKHLT